MERRVQVSVVIPTFNEQKYIKACLESLVNQTTSVKFEVIVVDNNSEDKTVEIAQGFKDKLNLKIVSEKRQGRGAARYRGFKEARSRIILSTDADTVIYPEWIDTLVKDIKGNVVATTTSCKTLDLGPIRNTIFNFSQPPLTVLFRLLFGYFWLAGFSFAILVSVYKKSGGFNPNLQTIEDVDLAKRVAKLGSIKFIAKPVIVSGRRFKYGLFKGLYQYIHNSIEVLALKKEDAYLNNIR